MSKAMPISLRSTKVLSGVILFCLTLQSAMQNIVVTWSRNPDEAGEVYDVGMAILLQEISKTTLSMLYLVLYLPHVREPTAKTLEEGGFEDEHGLIFREKSMQSDIMPLERLSSVTKEVMKTELVGFMLPATLYVIQNHLLLYSASRLSASSYAIFAQTKIFTTAIFTIILFKRHLTFRHWTSIVGLFFGVTLVQLSKSFQVDSLASQSKDEGGYNGLAAITVACFLSGYAGVYTEKLLKDSQRSLAVSSLQMSVCSIFPALIPVLNSLAKNYLEGTSSTMLATFGFRGFLAVSVNVCGGFLVVLTVRYTSSLAKSFATSCAIILTLPFAFLLLKENISFLQALGATSVVFSVFLYAKASDGQERDKSKELHLQTLGQALYEEDNAPYACNDPRDSTSSIISNEKAKLQSVECQECV